ncbi:hypothetical protein ES332_D06G057400v1 [Gossypium tomentosum]|uniref:ADP,ATP carrier protein n=1 Tax=Gossypium tomentosum TaxID=34277 RepID=A0A5D2KHA0_GOSTO|nr:hypothetical protein ES332_D06G057400v1 [Gossypium tomentosum]
MASLEIIKLQALVSIGKDDGIKGYWKGNLPQVIRVVPYSAVQLFAYETYKKLFTGKDGELSILERLATGACAGKTSTFVSDSIINLKFACSSGFLGVNQTHETLGQWCVVFMSFGVKEMDLGEDVDAVDGGL